MPSTVSFPKTVQDAFRKAVPSIGRNSAYNLLTLLTTFYNDIVDIKARIYGTHTLTVGGANTDASRTVTIQLKDNAGNNLAVATGALVWLSDAAGGAASSTAPSTPLSASTGTLVKLDSVGTLGVAVSNASGVIALVIADASNVTWYVNILAGDGKLYSSAAVEVGHA